MTAYKIEVVEVGPDGHTTIEIDCRDRAHRDEMMARIRGALDGDLDLRAKVEALLAEEEVRADHGAAHAGGHREGPATPGDPGLSPRGLRDIGF